MVTALQMGASVPTIYASLNARVMSSMKPQRMAAESILKGPTIKDFDLGTPDDAMAPLMDATVLSCIASYAQGMELLQSPPRTSTMNSTCRRSLRSGRVAASFGPVC